MKVEEFLISQKTCITTAKKLCKEKTDKNMKRPCRIHGQISTDFYRKTISISKIILNFQFLTKLGCGIGIEVPTEAIYAFSINLIYKIHLSLQDIRKLVRNH